MVPAGEHVDLSDGQAARSKPESLSGSVAFIVSSQEQMKNIHCLLHGEYPVFLPALNISFLC